MLRQMSKQLMKKVVKFQSDPSKNKSTQKTYACDYNQSRKSNPFQSIQNCSDKFSWKFVYANKTHNFNNNYVDSFDFILFYLCVCVFFLFHFFSSFYAWIVSHEWIYLRF